MVASALLVAAVTAGAALCTCAKPVPDGVLSFEQLLAMPPRADEDFETDEPTRFGRLSKRLWGGVQTCEQMAEG